MANLSAFQSAELTPPEAAALIRREVDVAGQELSDGRLDSGLDGFARALGLALQLGPAPTERVLAAILESARALSMAGDADALSALGPALVDLVETVRATGVLPATGVMDAWAAVATDVGALIGQLGLTLSIPARQRPAMMNLARERARLLDDATDERFSLVCWLDEIPSAA